MMPIALPPPAVSRWLLWLFALVGAMVVIGGITRLTGSGLSITEWQPIMGALPPMDDAGWRHAFELYQATPQFQKVNTWMTLSDFQGIFFWEYFHRLLGRLIGVVFFGPWMWFTFKKQLPGRWARRALVAFLLGGTQGALGWFMVASGLVDVPQVSHFRLAAHLSLALFVGQYLLWLWLDLRQERRGVPMVALPVSRRAVAGFLVLLSLQIVYGALMAGSRAGYLFQTFPDMNGAYYVGGDVLNDPGAIHFVHRTLAWVVAAFGLALAWRLRGVSIDTPPGWRPTDRPEAPPARSPIGKWLGIVLVGQVALGAATVMTGVNVPIAVAHQAGALALLSVTVACLHRTRPPQR